MNSASLAYIANLYKNTNAVQNPFSVSGRATHTTVSPPTIPVQPGSSSKPDTLSLSNQAKQLALQSSQQIAKGTKNAFISNTTYSSPTHKHRIPSENGLDERQLRQLDLMKQRDNEVRQHEHTHIAMAGQYAIGKATFDFKKGPDGGEYAVAGKVPLDISREKRPEDTISKMQIIKQAALAPDSPSEADLMVAAQADSFITQANMELKQQQEEEAARIIASKLAVPPPPSSPTLIINDSANETAPENKTLDLRHQASRMINAYSKVSSLT